MAHLIDHPQTALPASFGIYNSRRLVAVISLAIAIVFGVFAVFPQIDILVSGLFYEAKLCGEGTECGAFPAATNPGFAVIRSVLYAMPFVVLIGIVLFNTMALVKQQRHYLRNAQIVTALFASLLLGPGLLVNAFLKEHVLRVRPRDVTFFGGEFPFVPVGQWSGMCSGNCSFVSGEASIAPFLVLSILLFPKAWQWPAFLILFPMSLTMAFLRVVVGAHYLSDVMLGYASTILVFSILAVAISKFATKTQPLPVSN